ncbi:MAG: ParB/RepB/Spo0J family partition protein [Candidatus Methanomethyliaceae archaeon]
MNTIFLKLEELENHPRNNFSSLSEEQLKELADSIAEVGIIHPVVVRPIGENRYQIISGHQRRRAAEMIGLKEIPCIVVDVDDDTAELMLIDANLETRELSIMEMARAIRRRREIFEIRPGKRTDLTCATMAQVAEKMNLSRRQLYRLDKLNDLIPPLQDLVESKKLSLTAAERLAGLPAETQESFYEALGGEIESLTGEGVLRRIRELERENEAGYIALKLLEKEAREVKKELQELHEKRITLETLEERIRELKKQESEARYAAEDWANAAKRAEETAKKKGAFLIDVLAELGEAAQKRLPELRAMLEWEYDEITVAYAKRWAEALVTVGKTILENIKTKKQAKNKEV